MYRFTIAAAAILAIATPVAAAQTSSPASSAAASASTAAARTVASINIAPTSIASPATVTRVQGFSSRVHIPTGDTTSASAAECNRRFIGLASSRNALGINGATDSQTLVAVPVGGGSISNATTQQQISEVCAQ